MRKRIKIKAHVTPKCDCDKHYLELFHSADDSSITYKRFCYKCKTWWTYTEVTKTSYGSNECIAYSILGEPIVHFSYPRIERQHNTILFDDGRDRRDIYEVNRDGTLGKLIKSEKIQRW